MKRKVTVELQGPRERNRSTGSFTGSNQQELIKGRKKLQG